MNTAMRFPERLVNIINTCMEKRIGEWGPHNHFYIDNVEEFKGFLKPYKLSTLKRQFNYYGFRVSYKPEIIHFGHPDFTKDNYTSAVLTKNKRPVHNHMESREKMKLRSRIRRLKQKIIRVEQAVQTQTTAIQEMQEIQENREIQVTKGSICNDDDADSIILVQNIDRDIWDQTVAELSSELGLNFATTGLSHGHSLSSSRCGSPNMEPIQLDNLQDLGGKLVLVNSS